MINLFGKVGVVLSHMAVIHITAYLHSVKSPALFSSVDCETLVASDFNEATSSEVVCEI